MVVSDSYTARPITFPNRKPIPFSRTDREIQDRKSRYSLRDIRSRRAREFNLRIVNRPFTRRRTPASDAVVELVVSFRSSEHNVDPNAHRLRAGRHEMIKPGGGLDDEGESGLRRSDGVHVIHVDLLDRLRTPSCEMVQRCRRRLKLSRDVRLT